MIYLTRAAWNARPARGSTPLVASEVDGTAIHWPGMAKPISSQAAVASALRGWQDYHMDSRGWSDIAYQVAVDQAGRAWTLRGLQTRSAANGDTDVNSRYGAILLVLAPGEQPTEAMKATVRGVVTDFRAIYPNGTAIKPHSAVRPAGTDCPGDAARAAITRGDFTPRASTPEELTVGQYEDLKALIKGEATANAGRYSDLANRIQTLINQEANRYGYYADRLREILAAVAADDANDVTQADVDQILAKLDETHPVPKA